MTFLPASAGRDFRPGRSTRLSVSSPRCDGWRERANRRRASMAADGQSTLDSIDIGDLLRMLPHRYPFLLVDRIQAIDDDDSAIGIKNVTFNEPHFQGHFPGTPVMPGVLIVEAMAQTAGAICLWKMRTGKPSLVYFMMIDNA